MYACMYACMHESLHRQCAHVRIYLLRCPLRILLDTLPLLFRPFASSYFLVSFLPRDLLRRHLVEVKCMCVYVRVCVCTCGCVCVCTRDVCACGRMYVCGVFLCIVMIRESLREFAQNYHFQKDNNRIQNYYFLQQKCVHSFLFA